MKKISATKPKSRFSRPEQIDYLIVGGGISGLYTAYKLQGEYPKAKILVLEAQNRCGGRLESDRKYVSGKEVVVENGGMRFTREHHSLSALIDTLGLDDLVIPFDMGGANNLYHFRGNRFTRESLERKGFFELASSYRLGEDEAGNSSGAIYQQLIEKIVVENGKAADWRARSSEEWSEFRNHFTYRGVPIRDFSLNLLLDQFGLSGEAIKLLGDMQGFHAPHDLPANAGAALQLITNITPETQFLTFKTGYESLPYQLAQEVRGQGGEIREGYRVIDICKGGIGEYLVTAKNSSSYESVYSTSNIVLALPQSALRKLGTAEVFSYSEYQALVETVVSMPLTKINLFFKEAWWEKKAGIQAGGNFTDQAIGQIYTFRHHLGGPAAMTLYSDSHQAENFWTNANQLGLLAKSSLRQLEEVFGFEIPEPAEVSFNHWGPSQPLKDGDHLWKVGVDDEQVRRDLVHFLPGISIVGESYSDEQSWVEGALRSSEYYLQHS